MYMRKHDDPMPVGQSETMIYQRDGQNFRLSVGTPAWYVWLSTATTFSFRSAFGAFTARKEQASNKRGGGYLRAYRKHDSKLHRVYVGKSEELTPGQPKSMATTPRAQDRGR